jgi:hypothetical protein
MNEEMMTAGTGGFSGSAAATGPNAGYDPVMKFRSKVKSKKDKKLVMPGNELKAEDNRSYREKLDDIVSERINNLKEYVKNPSHLAPGASYKDKSLPLSTRLKASDAPLDLSGKSRFQRGTHEFAPKAPKKVPAANTANPSPSQAKPNPMQANRPGFDGKGISNTNTSSLSGKTGSGGGMAGAAVAALKKAARKKKGLSAMKEAASAPQDQPVGLYQYKVTVPEMGTTIIYASSPAELMIKFRMLFNPRFIKQIKIERISPHKAGELFYVKRLKHLRNIKSD